MDTPLAKETYNYFTTKLQVLIRNIVVFTVESAEEKDAFIQAAIKTKIRELIDFATSINVEETSI